MRSLTLPFTKVASSWNTELSARSIALSSKLLIALFKRFKALDNSKDIDDRLCQTAKNGRTTNVVKLNEVVVFSKDGPKKETFFIKSLRPFWTIR